MTVSYAITMAYFVWHTLPYLIAGNGYFGGYPDNFNFNQNQAGGFYQNQIYQDAGFSGYKYTAPRIPFRYPEEFENKYRKQGERERDSQIDRDRTPTRSGDREVTFTTERPRDRDQDVDRKALQEQQDKEREEANRRDLQRIEDNRRQQERQRKDDEERRQRDEELVEKNRMNEEKLKQKVQELEEREETIRRERQEIEVLKQREQMLRKQLVDELVAEHRNRTLEELQRFGQNLKQNQQLEDEARDIVVPPSERRFKFTEEREEIIRRGGQTPIINRSRNTTVGSVPPENGSIGGSRSRFESESSFSRSSTGGRPTETSPRNSDGFRNRFDSESSRRQSSSGVGSGTEGTPDVSRGSASSSRSSSSSSRSSSSGSSLDSTSSGSFHVPTRQRFESFFSGVLTAHNKFVSPIANDPVLLSVASRDEVLEKTGALISHSTQFDTCPPGNVFSRAQKRCIKWG